MKMRTICLFLYVSPQQTLHISHPFRLILHFQSFDLLSVL